MSKKFQSIAARDRGPGPGRYGLPTTIGYIGHDQTKHQKPAYPMGIKLKTCKICTDIFSHSRGSYLEDWAKTPGPCGYNHVSSDVTKNRKPIYTMLARNEFMGDRCKKPGPGDHWPENVKSAHVAAPMYTMGIRHSEYLTPLIVDVPADE